jgi:hypothetical protein
MSQPHALWVKGSLSKYRDRGSLGEKKKKMGKIIGFKCKRARKKKKSNRMESERIKCKMKAKLGEKGAKS